MLYLLIVEIMLIKVVVISVKNIKYYTIRASQLEKSLEIETRGATFQPCKSKPDPKSTVLASSSKVAWKKELADQYRKHEMIKQHILQGKRSWFGNF